MTDTGTAAPVAPVVKTITVNATPARAFEVFTANMTRWWPITHTIRRSEAPIAEIVLEPRVGGRWYERGTDGSMCSWGHVVAWDPPKRVVLAWQINADWQFDPALISEVEVLFQAQGTDTTLVTLEHGKLDAFGAAAAKVRQAISSEGGWGALLGAYANAFR
jgi:uncharacterized protein YndB with AHSA1/START domain